MSSPEDIMSWLPTVESLAGARNVWSNFEAVISIEDAACDPGDDRSFQFPCASELAQSGSLPAHLRLVFDDIDEPFEGYVAPDAVQIRKALDFGWEHRSRRLLVHCHSGQCRSTAIALGIIAGRLGPGRDAEAVDLLLKIRPIAAPNLIALGIVDAELQRNGALQSAWMSHENGDEKLLRLRFLRQAYYSEADRKRTP